MPKQTITIKRLNQESGVYEKVGTIENLDPKVALELVHNITSTVNYVCYIADNKITQEKTDAFTF